MPQNGEWEVCNVDSEEGINSSKDKQRMVRQPVGCVLSEIMHLQADTGSMEPELEHFLGGNEHFPGGTSCVSKELAKQMHPCNEKWDSGNETHPSESRGLELKFLDKPSLLVWTGTEIKSEDNTSIRIALCDGFTGQVVNSGPEASAKCEIVVIENDFNGSEGEEFDSKIVREMEGRKSPLIGDVYLNLEKGIGVTRTIRFRHTKCWMTRQKFRLGARMVEGSHGVRVREATTEPFIVGDRRGNLYGKHYPPSLSDEVWRLDKIGKDGAFHKRLSIEKIITVKDFLTLLNINPQKLKEADAHKLVESAFQHWGEVVPVDDEASLTAGSQQLANALYPSNLTTLESPNMIDLYGNMQQDTSYTDIISLGSTTTADDFGLPGVENLDFEQGQFLNSIISDLESVRLDVYDNDASFVNVSSFLPNVLNPSNSVITESSYDSEILTSHNICGPDNPQLGASSHEFVPPISPIWDVNLLEDFDLQGYEQTLTFTSPDTNSLICNTDSMIQAFCKEGYLQISDNLCSTQHQDPHLSIQRRVSVLAGFSDVTMYKAQRRQFRKRNAQRRWRMLFTIMRCCFQEQVSTEVLIKKSEKMEDAIQRNEMVLSEEESGQRNPFESQWSELDSRVDTGELCGGSILVETWKLESGQGGRSRGGVGGGGGGREGGRVWAREMTKHILLMLFGAE
ncbi:calmodulin binding protein-like protein [Actinidia rufa]|uniref:Calmodulin binding protein-like protein n=1 Tax=Actinidia rufa TaxID=165716 RepID=A0A7J0DBM2_9ERIC|nr:calmodulin binding protein-like protein [Actinidia rufa]